MVCIEKRPHKMRGRSLAPNFIYLTCLLDREHIIVVASFSIGKYLAIWYDTFVIQKSYKI